ncbi:MAG: J domain-containing protein [Chloroflexi bacterium]|nr:J domain-containing protein [Chloroflexota bacterium]
MKDYYGILGLPRSAGPDSINDAKRRLSFLYHPDSRAKDMDGSWADERIREINEAWDVLSDPARRAAYDRATPSTRNATALPVLAVSPLEVELIGIAPNGLARFAVDIVQVGGPPFDAAIHDLEIGWGMPWDKSQLRYDAGGSVSPPLTLTFEMDLSASGFNSDTEYVGDFVVNAVARAS